MTTLLLLPYLPRTGEQLLEALGEESRGSPSSALAPVASRSARVPPLFPKIEAPA